jgi:hypothetical protein
MHVPIYGYVTAPFSVSCEKEGLQESIAVDQPCNETIANRRAATSSAGAGADANRRIEGRYGQQGRARPSGNRVGADAAQSGETSPDRIADSANRA